ncbi:hypothetical protein [Sorangium sp. So ce1182]|uniref:hypothetical protein n=1 Tax=Sorangium sp. So ce1182 TaxID=3133334 RepID=UPI003F63E77B
MRSKIGSWGLVLAMLAIPAIAQASDTLRERESRAIRAYTGADRVARSDGYYAQARDAFLTGTGSISALTSAWNKDALAWMTGWFKAFAIVDLNENIPYTDLESNLNLAMSEQETSLWKLKDRARAIQDAATEARRLLDLATVPQDIAELAAYTDVLTGLAKREAELRQAITDVAQIPMTKLPQLEDVRSKSHGIIMGRLRAALIAQARYPLDETLAAVQAYLDAEAVVEPVVARVTAAENEMNAYTLNLQIYHADDALATSRATCNDGKNALSSVHGPAAYLNAAKQRVNQLCSAIEDHYNALASAGLPRSDIVFQYVNTAKAGIRTVCGGATPPVSCERLAVLAGLGTGDLRQMDDPHLRFIEFGFSQAMDAAKRRGDGS